MSNDYTVNWSNGTLKTPFTLPANSQDTTTTSLTLTGKGSSNWGEPLQENQLKLLEHFASDVAPANPTIGQLWYDSATTTLKMYELGNVWKPIYSLNSISRVLAPVSPSNGQLWYDTTVNTLKHWDGSEWIPIYSSTSLTNETAPSSPKIGQLWYRSSINTLHIYNGTDWIVIFSGNSISSSTAPTTPVRGQLWFDTTNNVLKIYDNTNSFVPIAGGAISIVGDLNMNNYKIINLANGTASTHGINKGQLDAAIATVTTSVTNLTNTVNELKVYGVYQDTVSTGVSSTSWSSTVFSGIGGPSTWPAAWSSFMPPFITTNSMSSSIVVTGPTGKSYRVMIVYAGMCTFGNLSTKFNSATKILVNGAVSGSGGWNVGGDIGLMGTGGDHAWGKNQNAAGVVTSDHHIIATSLSQTFTGTNTFEVRTYGQANTNPGATGHVLLHDVAIFLIAA